MSGVLVVFYEGIECADLPLDPRIYYHDLEESPLLKTWLGANRDVIPVESGGELQPCSCAQGTGPGEIHNDYCPWMWFNRNAHRWFRKLVSLSHCASTMDENTVLVWIDSDAVFNADIDEALVASILGDGDVFYFRGASREVLDSGVLGIKLTAAGRRVIEATLQRYMTGEYRTYTRWDDGFQIQKTLDLNEVKCIDLGGAQGDVINGSLLGKNISHDRGVHRVFHRVMR